MLVELEKSPRGAFEIFINETWSAAFAHYIDAREWAMGIVLSFDNVCFLDHEEGKHEPS